MRAQEFLTGVAVLLGAFYCLAAPAPPGRLRERATLEGHLGAIHLAFSPDGKTLATVGGGKQAVRLWDVASGRCTAVLTGHTTPPDELNGPRMTAVAFSADGKALATSSREEVKVWDLAGGRCTATLAHGRILGRGAHALAFSPDGKSLFAYHDPLALWDLQTHKERAVYPDVRACTPALALDPKGKMLFAGSDRSPSTNDRAVFALWDAETGKQVFVRDLPYEVCGALAFSRDGKVLATVGHPSAVQLWEVATGRNLATFDDRPGRITFLAFSPDGKVLGCAFQYLTKDTFEVGVRLYETRTGKVLATLKGKFGPYAPLAFSPDGRILATGDWHGKITLWDLPRSWNIE